VPKAVGLASRLKTLEGVVDAYATFGRFDILAFFECRDESELFKSVSEAASFEGIVTSETLMEILSSQRSEYGKGPFSS